MLICAVEYNVTIIMNFKQTKQLPIKIMLLLNSIFNRLEYFFRIISCICE